jgi:AcrR family transcriptional regulator
MEAACEEFERNGYAGTTTAAIARNAGVVEALIFSNFGSKAQLFRDSIFKPLNRHLLDFCATHLVESGDPKVLRKESQQYILELQRFIEQHSAMLVSLVGAQMWARDDVDGLSETEGLEEYFARTTAMAKTRLGKHPKIDPKTMGRISFATILSCVLFKDWLFPKGVASDEKLRTSITNFVLDGINANAASRIKPR